MASCKLPLMVDPHLTQTRNSQSHFSMIPIERVKLSTRRSRPRPQCLFSSYSSADTHDDEDHHLHQNKQSGKKINIQGKDSGSIFSQPPLEDAVVKLICLREDTERLPLHMTEPSGNTIYQCPAFYSSVTTNAIIIEGRRLLTCAHCIEDRATIVQVHKQKKGSSNIYCHVAKVLAISKELDLAILTVSQDTFWEGVGCVELGDMPSLGDKLTTVSYLEGIIDTITSKSDFVLDMGMFPFFHGEALAVYSDSKFGESGSVIFNENGKCVGMAFDAPVSTYQGRVVPATIIKHFIEDFDRNGGYIGVPIFGVKWQKMENHDLRMYMGMQQDQEGVRIIDTSLGCPEFKVLKLNDVILSIDGVKIANDGTVPFWQGRRVDLNYLFTQKCKGDNVLVEVLRNSIYEFNIKLATPEQFVPGVVEEDLPLLNNLCPESSKRDK